MDASAVRHNAVSQTTVIRHILRAGLALSGGFIGILGCSGDTTNPVSLPPSQTYWALQLNWHAVNLALTSTTDQPGADTVQLQASARNALGAPLPGATGVRYHGVDSTVIVDSLTGHVTAKYLTNGTPTVVVASLTVRGVTLVDTAQIQVTQDPLPARLATFSIQPRPDGLDSAKFAMDGVFYFPQPVVVVYATMATGNVVTDTVCNVNSCSPQILISFSTSDSTIATIDQYGTITPKGIVPGRVTFGASTYVYGVAAHDSLPFVIGWPITGQANHMVAHEFLKQGNSTPELLFGPSSVTIGVGGGVVITNQFATPIDVVFDSAQASQLTISPDLGDGRNILNAWTATVYTDTSGTQDLFVTFNAAGQYPFHSTLFGTRDTITVSSGP